MSASKFWISMELPGVGEDGMSGRNVQRKLGTTRGSPRRSRTAKALRISRYASTGTKFQNVPFKGGGPAVQALVSGVVPLGMLASSSVAPQVTAGTVRVLAVTSAMRS